MNMRIPKGWVSRKPGGHIVMILQKQLKTSSGLEFPTVIMEAGTVKENSFPTYFDNSLELANGSLQSFNKNELYSTNDTLDSIKVNGLQLYFFESRLDNKKFNRPDLVQTHYYFNVDSMFFHLSVSDLVRFEELKNDYDTLVMTIKPK